MWATLSNSSNDIRDVVIVAVPWTDTDVPMMAPAVLKPIVEKAGLSCLAVDLNQEIFQYTKSHNKSDLLTRFFFDGHCYPEVEYELNQMFVSIAKGILSYKPKWVGLSLLSYGCQHAAKWIAWFLKKYDPDVKIIFGGAGCLQTFTGPALFIEQLKAAGYVDYHIRGDAEHSLYELLIGNDQYHGIGTEDWKELSNQELAKLPIPNYDDYCTQIYPKKIMPILGSRGCVRQCTFCDYIANWKKFQWRTGADIFAEMLHQNQRYGVNYFKFQDALINGNQKEFRSLIELVADHNDKNPHNQFKWSSFYIFREITPHSQEEWSLIHRSGADVLLVGIENLNQNIRYAMGKKFSNASIDFHLEQAQRYRISLVLGQIVGYVNETDKDIEFIKHWLKTHVKFKDIIMFQWGGTLGIFPNTYLEKNQQELGITLLGPTPQHWVSNVTSSTAATRSKWVKELVHYSKELGYQVSEGLDNHYILESLSNESNRKF